MPVETEEKMLKIQKKRPRKMFARNIMGETPYGLAKRCRASSRSGTISNQRSS